MLQKKSEIAKIAASVFAKYGFSKTTLEDISNSLGMKKNSLYYYFPSKEAIFGEVLKENLSDLLVELKKISAGSGTAEEKLKMFFTITENYKKSKGSFYNLTTNAFLDIRAAIKDLYDQYTKEIFTILNKIILEGVKSKEFKKCDPNEVALALKNFIESIELSAFQQSKAKYISEVDFGESDKTKTILLDLIFEGLKSKS
ncbi:MAG TPA: TetR/AcrR family transcriptional regulator [Ignavibacteriaceae bacterium]|nr:TetR/AcrR family transcriptional regulator [Ignavibacteriaceae bacterium]